jgi:nitric oxide reductase activation protein
MNKEDYRFERSLNEHKDWIAEGIRRGIVLGKKLKVRAEERNTKFNRQRSGRIDKRMIANAGFGAEAIFAKIESFAYNPGLIHISIDNSGSMNGSRFENAQKAAVAIAKACSMIENMDCIISYRSSAAFGVDRYHHANKDVKPVVLIAYDSRMHGMAQIKTLLPYVETASLTPEGLCFDAIMKDIVDASRGKDSYFVNMCDGSPYYNDYYGDSAVQHTKAQVKKMRYEGIKVISYFITSSMSEASVRESSQFKTMYGKDSQFVDTNKIGEIARTMNSKFLETA